MRSKTTLLYGFATALMCATGALPQAFRVISVATFLLGALLFVVTAVRGRLGIPGSAISLLIASNFAFWASILVWASKRKLTMTPQLGIDPFARTLALWLVVLSVFSIYELVVLVRNAVYSRDRRIPIVGILGIVLQLPTSMWFAWDLVRGV